MPYVPPWLDFTPEFFLQAAAEGERTGLEGAGIIAGEKEAGAERRQRSEELSEQERNSTAQQALESARLAAAAEDASYARRYQAQQDALARQNQQQAFGLNAARLALENAKQNQPYPINIPGGGVLMFSPTTGATTPIREPVVRPYRVGNQLIDVDPATGQPGLIYTAPPPAGNVTASDRERLQTLRQQYHETEENLRAAVQNNQADQATALRKQLDSIGSQIDAIENPAPTNSPSENDPLGIM